MMEDNAAKRNRQIKQEKQVKALADAHRKSAKNKDTQFYTAYASYKIN